MIRNFFNRLSGIWADLHPAGRLLILLVLAGTVGFFGLKPAYSAVKKWRIEQNLTDARKAVDESRMDEARDLSLNVLRSGDPRIDAYRILEKSTASLKDPRHGDISRALMFHPDSGLEDRLVGFQGIVTSTPLGLVGQAWASLPEETRKGVRFAVAFARRLIDEKRWNESTLVLLAVPEDQRNEEWSREMGTILIGVGTYEAYGEAQRMSSVGIVAENADVPLWLELLEKIPVFSLRPELLVPVQKKLKLSRESARFALMLARIDCAGNFSSRSQIIDAAVEKWLASDPVAVASFASGFGLNQLLLKLFTEDSIRSNPELSDYLLDAMVETDSWEAVKRLAESHPSSMSKEQVLGYRAIAVVKLGDAATGRQLWTKAIEEARASHQANALLNLREIAIDLSETDLADKALIEAIRLGRGPLPLYSELGPLLRSLRNDERENVILDICASYMTFEPGNPILLTQYAYLAFMNGIAEPATVLAALEPLAAAFPKELPIQRVLAVIYVCDGRFTEAGEIFGKQEPELDVASEYLMAYFVAEALTGKMDPNDPKISNFPKQRLLPSERKKFREAIGSGN